MNMLRDDTEFAFLLHEMMWVQKHVLSAVPDSNNCHLSSLMVHIWDSLPYVNAVFQLNSYLSVFISWYVPCRRTDRLCFLS